MLWYFSLEKTELLLGQKDGWSFLPKSVEVQIKAPFTSIESILKRDEGSAQNWIEKLLKRLKNEALQGFHEVPHGSMPLLCTFEAEAARLVDDKGFWAALAQGNSALLLAGSALNSIGKHGNPSTRISPSADPIGAVVKAFESGVLGDIPWRLSYAWRVVWGASAGQLSMPYVRGVCVLAGVCEAALDEMRLAKMPGLRRLLIGSPVFVRQVGQ